MKINGYMIVTDCNCFPIGIACITALCTSLPTIQEKLYDIKIRHIYFYHILTRPYIQNNPISDKFEIVSDTDERYVIQNLTVNLISNLSQLYVTTDSIINLLFLKLYDAKVALSNYVATIKENEYILTHKNISPRKNINNSLLDVSLYCDYSYLVYNTDKDSCNRKQVTGGILECRACTEGYIHRQNNYFVCDWVLPIAFHKQSNDYACKNSPYIIYDNYSPYNIDKPNKCISLNRPLRFKFGHLFLPNIDKSAYPIMITHK